MSEADEMFFKLGFEKKENAKIIEYYMKLPIWQPCIIFNKKNKSIKADLCLSIPMLQAINEMVKELGWNENG